MAADEEAFKLLLELAGEEEAELEGELKEPDDISYIPASDGDESAENEDCNLLSNLADGIESLEQSRKGNPAVPGFQAMSKQMPLQQDRASKKQAKMQTNLPDCSEKYSGLAITKTIFPLVVLHERFAALSFLKISQLRSRLSSKNLEGPWATIGVLSQKSKPRVGSGNRAYSIWTLSDLNGSTVSVFLFGASHNSHFTEPIGAVFALFNAKIRTESGNFNLSVDTREQLLRLGSSKDYGYCKGRKKDGQACRNPVNKSICAYCEHHVQAELKKMSTNRAQLRGHSLKSALRNGTTLKNTLHQDFKPRHFLPIKPCSKEQLLHVAKAQQEQKSSLGARYIKKMADEPSESQYIDPDVARGCGVFMPSNRTTLQEPGLPKKNPALNKDTSNLNCEANRPCLPSTLQETRKPRLQQPASSRQMPQRLAPSSRPDPPDWKHHRAHTHTHAGPNQARNQATSVSKPGECGPKVMSRTDGFECTGATQQTASMRMLQNCNHESNGQDAARRGSEEEQEVVLDDELILEDCGPEARLSRNAAADNASLQLEECEIEWTRPNPEKCQSEGMAISPSSRVTSHRVSHSKPHWEKGSHGRRTGVATTHNKCVLDEETGEMVEVDLKDTDWLNGRAQMPHERRTSFGRSSSPAICSQEIAQKMPNCKSKEAKAAQQAGKDAQARIRAAEIFRRKNSSQGPESSSSGELNPKLNPRLNPRTKLTDTDCTAPKPGQGVSAFYAASATAKAKQSRRMFSKVLQAGAGRNNTVVSDFTAAFGSVLDNLQADDVGTRYRDLVREEEDDKLDGLLSSMQTKDELLQKAEAVTKLKVSAFQCNTCNTLTEYRRTGCKGHNVQRVSATKRWWLCIGCGHHIATVGVRLPTARCPRCPSTDFSSSSMSVGRKRGSDLYIDHACKENLVTTTDEARKRSRPV